MKRLLLFAMAIIFAMQLSAQTTIVVGDTTTSTTSNYFPIYWYYGSSFSESIYPASELAPGLITSVSYYYQGGSFSNGTITIYMKEVDQTTLSNVLVGSDFTEVYSGPASSANGCNSYMLTSPFAYSGAGNLLVAVIRNGSTYDSDYGGYKKATVGSSYVNYYDDVSYNINSIPSSPLTSSMSGVPVTKFEIAALDGFCYPPGNLSYSDLEQTGVTINWAAMDESSTTFGLAYKTVDEEEWTVADENITDLTYTLSGLESFVEYEVKVYTVCSESNSTEISTVFTTLPSEDNFITLPFEESFDDLDNLTLWKITNPNTNKWYVGPLGQNTTNEESGNGLYISNDEGVTNAYTNNATSVAHASVLINIEENTLYGISFDYKSVGEETCCDYVGVRLVPFGLDLGTSTTLSHMIDKSPYGTNNEWQRVNIEVPTSFTPGVYHLVFSWRNDYGDGENPPAAIDNVSIYTTSCTSTSLYPEVEVTETEESTLNMIVSLVDSANIDVTYAIQYRAAGQEEWTEVTDLTIDDFPYYITEGIEAITNYEIKVGVLCSDAEEVLYINPITILTPCLALPTPWTENFDVNPYNTPTCWNRYKGLIPASGQINTSNLTTSTSWSHSSSTTVGGQTSAMMRVNLWSTTYRDWFVTPSINLADDGVAKQLAFDVGLRSYGSDAPPAAAPDDRFIVMVSLDNGISWNIANGLVFADGDDDTEHNFSDLTNQMARYAYALTDENEEPIVGTVRFAFYGESTVSNGDNYLCVDNIAVEDVVDCPEPYNLQVPAATITSTTATATFGYYGDATTWEYVVVEGEGEEADPDSGSAEEISSIEPIELTDLTPATTYTFAVRAICESGESTWTTATFTTLDQAELVPYETTFDDGMWFVDNGATTPNAWVVGEGTGNEAPAAYISNDGSAYAASTTTSATISHLWKDFDFGETEDEFELTFDWKVTGYQEGNSVYGGIAAYLVECQPLPTSGLLNSDNIVAILVGSDEWQTERIFLGNVTGEKRLVFTALGYTTDAELAIPAAIDNVSISVSSCPQVQGVTAENITTSTIDVAWTETGADSYIITYSAEGSEEELTATATSSPFTLEDLTSTTRYIITVTGVCGSDEAVASNAIAATTLQEAVELPYTCDFEEEGANGWLLRNSTCTNQWYVGTRTGGTSRELFISSDGGTSATYSASGSVVVAEKLFQLGATDSIRISFDVTVTGESCCDYLKVFFVDPTVAINPTTDSYVAYAESSYATGTIGGAKINQQNGTVNKVITIENPALNGMQKLVFLWRNDGSLQSNPPAIIDNVSVEGAGEEVTCIKPISNSVVASDETQTSAIISWTDNTEDNSAWNVYYKAEGEEEWSVISASEQTIELSDLMPDTQYSVYVTTDCGGEESTPTATITFRTECVALTAPMMEDFTTNVTTSPCWQEARGLLSNNITLDYSSSGWGHSTGEARVNVYGTDRREWLITPQIDLGEEGTLYELSLKVALAEYYDNIAPEPAPDDKFAIVISTDGGITWSSENALIFADGDDDVAHNYSDFTNSFVRITYPLQDAEGNPLTGLIKVGFYAESTQSNGDNNLFIDDLTIALPTSCAEPVSNSVVVSDITGTSATISWTDNDESHTDWNVYYKSANEEEYSMIAASEQTIELTDLSASTTYSVYVTTNCGDEESFPTSIVSFNTLCDVISDFPYFQGFESGANCWSVEAIQGVSSYFDDAWNVVEEYDLDIITFISGNAIWHTYEPGVSGRLITPMFDLTSLTNPYIKFDYAKVPWQGVAESLTVHYKASAEDSWTELATMNGTPDQWVLDSIALPNPSETYQIAFVSAGIDGYGVLIDNVTVYDAEEGGEDPEPEPCDAPTALAASNITQTSADITWNGTASTYEFKLNSGAAETLTTTSKALTGLTANTTYTVEVRAVCEDQTSDWVTTTFTTLAEQGGEDPEPEPCDAPTNLSASNITETTAEITWNGTATTYEFKLNGGEAETLTTTTKALTGLTPNTAYTVEVRSICEDQQSAWVTTNFTTLEEQVVIVLGEVTTTPATNVGNTSATLNGALVSAGESENFTVGFALATVADFTLEDNNVQNITATLNANTFSQSVNDLVEGQTYFYRAYITNEAGTAYGTVETFTLSGLNDAIAGMLQATIYPNPAQDNATMEIVGLDQDAKIVISDLQGRILSQEAISAGTTRYTVNVSNMASGVYYIRIVTDKAVSTQKLIVE